jgi:predicted cupin superfamily sugar epimerase
MPSAEEIIRQLSLEPLPGEGGFYRETYRAAEKIPREALPERYRTEKSFSTAIYYLLTPQTCSAIHCLLADEIFHFYLGDPVLMLKLHPDGRAEEIILGREIDKGQFVQIVVPAGTWQGCLLREGGSFALLGTTVAPGFDFSDYEAGDRKTLLEKYPEYKELIEKLTPR